MCEKIHKRKLFALRRCLYEGTILATPQLVEKLAKVLLRNKNLDTATQRHVIACVCVAMAVQNVPHAEYKVEIFDKQVVPFYVLVLFWAEKFNAGDELIADLLVALCTCAESHATLHHIVHYLLVQSKLEYLVQIAESSKEVRSILALPDMFPMVLQLMSHKQTNQQVLRLLALVCFSCDKIEPSVIGMNDISLILLEYFLQHIDEPNVLTYLAMVPSSKLEPYEAQIVNLYSSIDSVVPALQAKRIDFLSSLFQDSANHLNKPSQSLVATLLNSQVIQHIVPLVLDPTVKPSVIRLLCHMKTIQSSSTKDVDFFYRYLVEHVLRPLLHHPLLMHELLKERHLLEPLVEAGIVKQLQGTQHKMLPFLTQLEREQVHMKRAIKNSSLLPAITQLAAKK